MRRTRIAIVALALAAAVGCSHEPPPTPENDSVAEEPSPPPEPTPAPTPAELPPEPPKEAAPPTEANAAYDEVGPPDVSLQTQEDADAVGMTTRARSPSSDAEDDTPADGNGS